MREVSRNGVDEKDGFVFPSYVEDILGPELFDYGYGPFRWVCLSGKPDDLRKTDRAAMDCIDPNRRGQDRDNWAWIRDAEKNRLVVGTQARILYQDAMGRTKIALRFNEMVRNGETGPIMLGRDHHDCGGTDSPFRETSNIKDGSNVMADMAVQYKRPPGPDAQGDLALVAGRRFPKGFVEHDHLRSGHGLAHRAGLDGIRVVGHGDQPNAVAALEWFHVGYTSVPSRNATMEANRRLTSAMEPTSHQLIGRSSTPGAGISYKSSPMRSTKSRAIRWPFS